MQCWHVSNRSVSPGVVAGALHPGARPGVGFVVWVDMIMAEYADKSSGSKGIRRALSRLPNSDSLRRMVGNIADSSDTNLQIETPRRRSADFADAQRKLKEDQESTNAMELWPLPGLAPMTRVRTSFGDVHAIALRKGDKVLLRSGEHKAIQWINRISLDEHILRLKPDSNPILIASGSLAPSMPANEIMVSPRQVFCADERSGLPRPREASMLLSRTGIRRIQETGLTYTMFHVGEAADIYCEGLFLRFPIET